MAGKFYFEHDGRLWSQGFDVVDGNPVLTGEPQPRKKGFGDRVAAVTKAVGFKPCQPCQKRRDALNEAFPSEESA